MSNLKPATEMHILQASNLIRRGKTVAFPTETVYGLGADATNGEAVASLFAIKDRPRFNPLIVHLATYQEAEIHGEITETARMLIRRFWPGGLTLVVKRSRACPIADLVSAGGETVALRVPNHPIAQSLIRTAARPIAAPSANQSGSVSPTRADHVADSLGEKVPLILNGGPCMKGLESTVVDVSDETPRLLRPGIVPLEDIQAVRGPLENAAVFCKNGEKHKSPGQSEAHYAPSVPLRMNAKAAKKKEAFVGFGPDSKADISLSPTGDLKEAAARLFSVLRELEKSDCAGIAVAPIPGEGLGQAINDRLKRAAAGARKGDAPAS